MELSGATGSYRIAGCGPHIGLALNTAGRWGFYPHRFAGHDSVGAMRLAGHLVVEYVDGAGQVGLEKGVMLAFLEETLWPRILMALDSADLGTMWRKDLWACEAFGAVPCGPRTSLAKEHAGHKWGRAPSSAGHSWFWPSSFAGQGYLEGAGVRADCPFGNQGCGPLRIWAHAFAGRVSFGRRGARAGECSAKRRWGPSWRLRFWLAGHGQIGRWHVRAVDESGSVGCEP